MLTMLIVNNFNLETIIPTDKFTKSNIMLCLC